jgi:hypothetical protein
VRVDVECYAGYKGEQTPRVLRLDGQRLEIRETIDQWLAPDHRYFKVRADDGALYILRHDTSLDSWELVMFER